MYNIFMPPEIKPPTAAEIEEALKSGLAKNPEIGHALEEFEAKEVAQVIPSKDNQSTAENIPGMVRLVFRLSGGAIKEQRQAEYLLLGIVVLAISISIYLFFGNSSGATPSKIDSSMLQLHPELAK
jgi:hypothetical protein